MLALTIGKKGSKSNKKLKGNLLEEKYGFQRVLRLTILYTGPSVEFDFVFPFVTSQIL